MANKFGITIGAKNPLPSIPSPQRGEGKAASNFPLSIRWGGGQGVGILLGVFVLALILFSGVDSVNAQGSGGEDLPPGVTWDEVNGIAHQMYCDVCEGIPLDECESVACRNWRQEIARLLGEGYTEDEIINHFVARYGEEVAALPRDATDRWIAYIVPMILVGAVGVIGYFQVRQFRRRGQQAGQIVRRSTNLSAVRPVPDDVDPVYLARLEQELENLEL